MTLNEVGISFEDYGLIKDGNRSIPLSLEKKEEKKVPKERNYPSKESNLHHPLMGSE